MGSRAALGGAVDAGTRRPRGFIAGFAGDDRYIVDYLVEEVLQRQTEHVRAFLLETSILSRLNGALADAVTGQGGSKAMLEALERQNLLLIPLDDRRWWYRPPPLRDVLQARLRDERPEQVAKLHQRATEWYEQNGERAEAIRHAMTGLDFERAADLVELAMPETSRDRREVTLRQWLEALPDEVIRVRPVLSNGYAGSILVRGETVGVEARLQDAERWLDGTAAASPAAGVPASSMVVADEDAFRTLPARIAMHRAGLARLRGDVDGTIVNASRVLDLVAEDDDLGIGSGSTLLGLAYWTRGDLDAATGLYVTAMAHFEKADYLSDAIGLALALADMRIAQGRLHDAMRTYERGLELATRRGPTVLRGARGHARGQSAKSSAFVAISLAPLSSCSRPVNWARRTACRRTPTGPAWLLLGSNAHMAILWRLWNFLVRPVACTSATSLLRYGRSTH